MVQLELLAYSYPDIKEEEEAARARERENRQRTGAKEALRSDNKGNVHIHCEPRSEARDARLQLLSKGFGSLQTLRTMRTERPHLCSSLSSYAIKLRKTSRR